MWMTAEALSSSPGHTDNEKCLCATLHRGTMPSVHTCASHKPLFSWQYYRAHDDGCTYFCRNMSVLHILKLLIGFEGFFYPRSKEMVCFGTKTC